MILDGPLVAPGDENQVRDAGGHGFFHRVLDQGLSTTGSISFGIALVAGRKRVPMPATGKRLYGRDALKPRMGKR